MEKKNAEVITNCDNLAKNETVTNCEKLNIENTSYSQADIEKMILNVRGVQVMLDRDLARVYKVTTSQLNQQVKRNIARFPDSFRFQLTEAERDKVVTICDNLRTLKFSPSLPFVFTEPGIAQLSSVLHSEKAIKTSVKIMSAFVAMRHFMIQNAGIMMRITNLERRQIETDEKIDLILDKMESHSPKQLPEQVFNTGCVWDAWTYLSEIIRNAKKRVILIDNYIDDRVLSLLDKRLEGVEATIYSRYNDSLQTDIQKHNSQYREIKFRQIPHRNHDRFLIIDEDIYLLGASVKDMGIGLCAITKMMISPDVILQMLK